jgi:hypothetical protein
MWKKACPDDYRKLRNLIRKSQLLGQQVLNRKTFYAKKVTFQIDFAALSQPVPSKPGLLESADDVSETESDMTNFGTECSPSNDMWYGYFLPLNLPTYT